MNVVHDVGAVMNVLRTIWSYPEEYKNTHLGRLFPNKSFCLTGEEYIYISRRIILFLNCISALTWRFLVICRTTILYYTPQSNQV